MPNPQPQVSEEAVEAAVQSFLDKRVDPPEGENLEVIRQDVREALEIALPIERKRREEEVRERLVALQVGEGTYPDGRVGEALDRNEVLASLFPDTEEGER